MAYVRCKIWSIVELADYTCVKPTAISQICDALIGSHGWVEVAINGGNAQSHSIWTGELEELMRTETSME